MKYFHRTFLPPETVLARASAFFGPRLASIDEARGRRVFAGTIGRIGVTVQAEGGHYTLITMDTDQVAESEADKLAKRFLTEVHTLEHSSHRPIGAY